MSQKLFYIEEGKLRLNENIVRDEFPFLIELPKKFSDVLNEYTELEPGAIMEWVRKKYYRSFKGSAGSNVHIAGCIYVSELMTERYTDGNLAWEGKISLLGKNYLMPDITLLNGETEIIEVQSFGKVPKKKGKILKRLKNDIKDLKLSIAISNDRQSINRVSERADKDLLKNYISTVYLHPKELDLFCSGKKASDVVKEVPPKYFY